ncbi:MAG: HEAT repeat domain-containing protein [Candidatus Aminicenantes bacterium]|nr:HEAT repeat domain-containing protein [Candidatus Aminicenantes bacterium]
MTEDKVYESIQKVQGDKKECLPLPSLIAAFKEDNPDTRAEAVEILIRIGKPAVALLISTLSNEVTDSRKYAARALGGIADARALHPLIDTLKDNEPAARKEAADALGKMGNAAAVKSLISTLEDTDALVRDKAAGALDRIGWEPANNSELSLYAAAKQKWNILPFIGPDAVEPLIRALKDRKQSVRDGAVAALGKMGNPAAVKPIIDALKEKYPIDQEKVFDTLSRIASPRTAGTFIDELNYDDYEIRHKAAEVLDNIGWEPANNREAALYYFAREDWEALCALGKDALEPLIAALKDKTPAIRRNAVETLGKIGDSQAMAPLIDVLNDEDASVRNEAVTALGGIVNPDTVKYLLAALRDSRYDKEKVIDALGEKGDSAAVEHLTYALQDTTWEGRIYREAAARALGKIGDVRAVEPLIAAVNSKFYEVRIEATEALGKIGDSRAEIPLINALKDENENLREAAVAAFCKISKPGAAESLIMALTDKDCFVRQGAANVLGQIGWQPSGKGALAVYLTAKQDWVELQAAGEHAVKPLVAVLEDENPEIRRSAVYTLGKIGSPEAVEPLIAALKNQQLHDPYMNILIEALGEIGDARALEHLTYFLNNFLEEVAKTALEKIRGSVSYKDPGFFCTKCFQRAKKNRIKYSVYENNVFSHRSITYYSCKNCHSNSYLLKKIEKIVILLDRNSEEAYLQEGDVLAVNWLKRKEALDFDEIRIENAGDSEVEELVKRLSSDPDDKRRDRYLSIPVYLSPGVTLSPGTRDLLGNHFKIESP